MNLTNSRIFRCQDDFLNVFNNSENTQRRKAKQMIPVWFCLLWSKLIDSTFPNTHVHSGEKSICETNPNRHTSLDDAEEKIQIFINGWPHKAYVGHCQYCLLHSPPAPIVGGSKKLVRGSNNIGCVVNWLAFKTYFLDCYIPVTQPCQM